MDVEPVFQVADQRPQQPAGEESQEAARDMGPLPGTAVTLLISLAVVWVLIIAYWLRGVIRSRKKAA